MYDHMKPTQRNFQPNVYISHTGTNDLPTNRRGIRKNVTFSKHLESESDEVVVSSIVLCGNSHEEAEAVAVNKLFLF